MPEMSDLAEMMLEQIRWMALDMAYDRAVRGGAKHEDALTSAKAYAAEAVAEARGHG